MYWGYMDHIQNFGSRTFHKMFKKDDNIMMDITKLGYENKE